LTLTVAKTTGLTNRNAKSGLYDANGRDERAIGGKEDPQPLKLEHWIYR
jgi:hypothetical protein